MHPALADRPAEPEAGEGARQSVAPYISPLPSRLPTSLMASSSLEEPSQKIPTGSHRTTTETQRAPTGTQRTLTGSQLTSSGSSWNSTRARGAPTGLNVALQDPPGGPIGVPARSSSVTGAEASAGTEDPGEPTGLRRDLEAEKAKSAMLCYAMLCYAMLRYAVLCYAMLRYAMLCCAMLSYATLC